MKPHPVTGFTEKEQAFVNLLIDIKTRKNVAQVLVFLASVSGVPSREIERGTGLRQPEVSLAVSHLIGKGWIKIAENKPEGKGRPLKIYSLSKPVEEIVNSIAQERREQAKHQIARVQKLRDYIA